MSGRNLRMFITNHRAEDAEKLVIRMRNGLGSQKYKPVDYEQLQALAEAKKMMCLDTDHKIQKILQTANFNKEHTLIKQHQRVWWQEQPRVMEIRQKIESQLQKLLEDRSTENVFYFEMKEYGAMLREDQEAFKTATVEPILQLRKDLKQRLIEMQHCRLKQIDQQDEFNSIQILQQVECVRNQQKVITDKLERERSTLEEQINNIEFEEEIPPHLDEIPEDVHYLECPYPDLKASVLQEFLNLNVKYKSQLENINHQLKFTDRNCGWTEDEHLTFQVIVDLYCHETQNRNMLYMDMLLRLLPHKSKQELIDHWRLWDGFQFKKEHRKVLIQNWTRDKKDLLMKTVMIFAEACIAHEADVLLANDRRKQQEICAELSHKVQQMRAQQEEMARLEAAIAAQKREREIEQERKKREKEMCRRATDKEKIKQHYAEKQWKREELEQRHKQRLGELKNEMAEQAERDRERVKHRQELLQERRLEKKALILQQMQEEEERQKHLDAYWQKFAVTAQFDPVRMMSDTEASKARIGIGTQEEFSPQKPLFYLSTYTDKQVVADPRVRIEQALREAGLHNTFYAREVLSKIPPARPPRRDMESTLFKD
ncbi:coiled-coil domain-containing protein 148-like [Scyliorhinus canicula]|uniref:coiled-coil domain-containing protein 148-like n=1 Tax=Scyliorhinus canicula TaxID=7830 RepID=UPI0018F2B05B|nr:coiled-coil domain-containing protein 148-like [Scyliorhinus canicula]XP_038645521.1 coiled-coil domain-containing protein 148-like [Scyliorhinus canicula]XP_038645523.1 coiled-coil domain-containing protein 148-like [Scyliorhinus canicula]XP_038645524.1 coiled-coil domain-containing protein 148-like [Scyliorhinus canicula]XP_038645525.1 coiled-coil domain-containing protein 148-like [Scyliorhinus canicula]XP_038645526.1 coiled-coil domain-containing protein 148-like [Scyliorhinus canicula]